MPFSGVSDSNIVSKKCGEVIITIKKNTKNVYSFNCRFCDTIFLQLKKFALHLEQDHVELLEEADTALNPEPTQDNKADLKRNPIFDNILVGEIKIEDCPIDEVKLEIEDENTKLAAKSNKKDELSSSFQDPLDTLKDNVLDNFLTPCIEINEMNEIKEHQNIHYSNDADNEEIEMHSFSDDHYEEQSDFSGEDDSSDFDWKKDYNTDDKYSKPNSESDEKEFILALIMEYHKTPQLWDTTQSSGYNLKQKEDLLQSITDNLNAKLKDKLKLYIVKKKLNFVCKQYEKEVERQLNTEGNVAENSDLWFYENMSFLKTIVENKLKRKRKKIRHPKVMPLPRYSIDLQSKPIYQNDTSFCPGCSYFKQLFEERFQDTIEKQQKIIVNQNDVIIKALAEQKALTERLLHQDDTYNSARSVFPITSIKTLNELNNNISGDNYELYVNMMKSLLKGRLSKTLTEVISVNVCMDVNIDGIHGKKRLKDFQAFFQALMDACRSLGSTEVEKDLRNALKIIKKRYIQAECIKNKNKKT